MPQFQLEGQFSDSHADLDKLEQENDDLRSELRQVKLELAQARQNSIQSLAAVTALRQVLNPLKRAILAIYGELDLVPEQAGTSPTGASSSSATNSNPNSNPKWEHWKKSMPGRPAEVIDLLLIHGSMSVKQLAVAMHLGTDNVYKNIIPKLNSAGLLQKEGGKYRLRDI